MRTLNKNNLNAREILLIVARAGIISIAVTSPFFLRNFIHSYFAEQSRKRRQQKLRVLRELQKRKYISIVEKPDGNTVVALTHKGKLMVRLYNLETMKLQKPKRWDRQWRVILYDIPTFNKRASDAFREKLKQLGVYQLQKSVWVSPYECINELEFLCGIFDININKHILYFTTPHIPKENILKRFFDIVE